jgi:hypothetical protein
MTLNLDKLRVEAERAFASKAAGGSALLPWRYMSDEERLRLRNPPPNTVTPALEAQLAGLRKNTPVVPQVTPSRWQAISDRVAAKRGRR